MAETIDYVFLLIAGVAVLVFFLYVTSIEKILQKIGFSKQEASTILLLTLFFGWLTVPIFPYESWWVGISIGGGIIPIIICAVLMRSRRVGLAEGAVGVVIVAFITYFITRPEAGVGIVADLPFAFAPALAAGLYGLSTFWVTIDKAAPLAYFSGVIGTLVGADVFHLTEILSTAPPNGETVMLSIGGANIFDMVYLTGIVAVAVDIFVFWLQKQQSKHGLGAVVAEFRRGAEGLPYAKEFRPAPKLAPGKKGKI
ncbi:MAG: DUF1614 domain-containing protein [Thermoplasmata archaeon]